ALAFGDHPKKPAARVVVFGVFLKMRGQLRDLLGKNRNLHGGRPRIFIMGLKTFDGL
ncbi:MAG: hypothetical protein UY71_C0007G0001, partial [Parcubacteria group bacterium GW2011_GWB1_52_7]